MDPVLIFLSIVGICAFAVFVFNVIVTKDFLGHAISFREEIEARLEHTQPHPQNLEEFKSYKTQLLSFYHDEHGDSEVARYSIEEDREWKRLIYKIDGIIWAIERME